MREIIQQLGTVRRRTMAMLIVQQAAAILAGVVGAAMLLILVDYLFRWPGAVRLVLLLIGGGALVYAAMRLLLPALTFRPTLTQIALRVEKVMPRVAGRLASSVEFMLADMDQSNQLAGRSVRDAESRLAGESVFGVISAKRTGWSVLAMVMLAGTAATLALTNPANAQIGVTRLLLPLGAAQWPARTGVESLMTSVAPGGAHARGQLLALRARVTKGDPNQSVTAVYRFQQSGVMEPWQRAVLTPQAQAGLHERLIDTNAEAVEIYFQTDDDATSMERIELVPPPAVVRAVLNVEPPAYASAHVPAAQFDLGTGTDDRFATESRSLVGSRASLTLELSKPLPMETTPGRRASWIAETFGWQGATMPEFRAASGEQWVLEWTLAGSRDLSLTLVDDVGLVNSEPIRFRIHAVEDLVPGVAIVEPMRDQQVLATAMVPITAEATDDVAVSSIVIEAHVQKKDAVKSDDVPAWTQVGTQLGADASAIGEINLSTLELEEGDVVRISALAQDVYDLAGETHTPVRSTERLLRIIGDTELGSVLRRELGAVRQNAIRIEAQQGELQDDAQQGELDPPMGTNQARIGERIAQQHETVDQVEKSMRMNRMDDPELASAVAAVKEALNRAGQASNRAVEGIRDANSEPGEEASEEAEREVVEAQQEVREELADLIRLLDSNEDAWVAQRMLQELREAQAELAEATEAAAAQTLGRDRDELTQAELSELERIAQKQRELADSIPQMVEQLRKRAKELEENDAQTASGLRAAADAAERMELERDMEQAAQQLNENQINTAMNSQQSANQTIQQMMEEMEQMRRAQAMELQRQLASLVQSIERLINVQTREIELLATGMERNDFAGRDQAMVRLSQNTRVVASEAREAGQEARRVARALDRAAETQGEAISALRKQVVDGDAALFAERASLTLLEEAKELASETLEDLQERQVREQREEILAEYRRFADEEALLRERTAGLEQLDPLDRQRLVEARQISQQQETLRRELTELRERTRELVEALVFTHAHRLIDDWARLVVDALNNGDVGVDVTDRQQQIVMSLSQLIGALEDLLKPPPEFAEGQQQQGGGAGAGQQGETPLIPPIAELRLLRGLQEVVYTETRSIEGRGDLDAAQRRTRLRELGEQQRDLSNLGQSIVEQLRSEQPPRGEPMPNGEDAKPGEGDDPLGPVIPGSPNAHVNAAMVMAISALAMHDDDPPTSSEPAGADLPKSEDDDSAKSLDELLGIDEEEKSAGDSAAEIDAQEELDRRLSEKKVLDDFELAVQKMGLAATMLDERFDPGIGTQRIQEEVLARLDAIIDEVMRQGAPQSMSSSSSSSQQQQQQQQTPPSQQQQNQQSQNNQRNQNPSDSAEGDPPPRQEGDLATSIEEAGAEWGSLPQRVRDMLMQGRRETYSSLYERLTQEYYRRLAEESSP